ncbi:hypothetical protein GCM10010412_079730 [Nonomuraea recticatena]|uniref:Uncharacterized protein n=1 Tax=Nonomuraea recticatena TaxID=46178 RepID=A0ABN3T009_9ACTN
MVHTGRLLRAQATKAALESESDGPKRESRPRQASGRERPQRAAERGPQWAAGRGAVGGGEGPRWATAVRAAPPPPAHRPQATIAGALSAPAI